MNWEAIFSKCRDALKKAYMVCVVLLYLGAKKVRFFARRFPVYAKTVYAVTRDVLKNQAGLILESAEESRLWMLRRFEGIKYDTEQFNTEEPESDKLTEEEILKLLTQKHEDMPCVARKQDLVCEAENTKESFSVLEDHENSVDESDSIVESAVGVREEAEKDDAEEMQEAVAHTEAEEPVNYAKEKTVAFSTKVLEMKVKEPLKKEENDRKLTLKLPQKSRTASLIEEERKYLLTAKSSFYSREAYNTLRTNLNFALAEVEGCKVVMITSALQSEGKSITAANMAITLAEAGNNVLLMDCDMRRPKLGHLLSLKAKVGLSDILIKPQLITENTIEYCKGVHVILAGSIPPNPSELLASARMKTLMEKVRVEYDYIVLDTPPVGMVTDAAVLAPQADGVLFVIRSGQSERGPVTQAVEQIEYTNARILGFVMTCVPLEKTNYGYSKYRYRKYARYGYRRYGKYGYNSYHHYGYGRDRGYGYGYDNYDGYGYGGYGGYGYGGYGKPSQQNREYWQNAIRDMEDEHQE